MEKITVEFSASPSLSPSEGVVVVLTLDDKGKSLPVGAEDNKKIYPFALAEHISSIFAVSSVMMCACRVAVSTYPNRR